MVSIKRKGVLWYVFRVPVYLYRWRLGRLFGRRCLLLTHIGRRSSLRRQTVLEVVEYRSEGPEVVVVNGFGPDSDWVRNIEVSPGEEVTIASQHFVASHRFLGEEEAERVIQGMSTELGSLRRSFAQGLAGGSVGSIMAGRVIASAWSDSFR